MPLNTKSDDEIIKILSQKFNLLRRHKEIKDEELVNIGGTNRVVLNNFRSGKSGITLKTFIRLMRGLGELDSLEALFETPQEFSPISNPLQRQKKRIHTKKATPNFKWEEDK